MENATELCGTWRLVSFETRLSGGDTLYPFGKAVKGLLIYTRGGYMSGKLMPAERPHFASTDLLEATAGEIRTAFASFIGYYGKYETDPERKLVKHYVEGSLFPNWEGQVQERFFELNRNHLTLTTPPMPYGEQTAVGILVWERIE